LGEKGEEKRKERGLIVKDKKREKEKGDIID
jgi:hypothetical protein